MKKVAIWAMAIWEANRQGMTPVRTLRFLLKYGFGQAVFCIRERRDVCAGIGLSGLECFSFDTSILAVRSRIATAKKNIHAHLDSIYSSEIQRQRERI